MVIVHCLFQLALTVQIVAVGVIREAVGRLVRAGYRVLLVTNQAGIARGMVSPEALDDIHARMQADLRECGGGIDRIYCCPHGWDEGCECRKPKPGMAEVAGTCVMTGSMVSTAAAEATFEKSDSLMSVCTTVNL